MLNKICLKKLLSFCTLLTLSAVVSSLCAEEEIMKAASSTGEKITYSVKMGQLPIGEAFFTDFGEKELNGVKASMATFETRVTGFHDLEVIYSDPATLLPLRVERDIRQMKQERITEEYDQKNFSLTITKQKGKNTEIMKIEKKSPIHNAVILPFYLRHKPSIEPGWRFNIVLPTQEYLINFEGTQRLNTAIGPVECDYFTSSPKRFRFWITKDTRRIPVRITATSGLNYTMTIKTYTSGK